MNVELMTTPSDQAFREEVRAFIRSHLSEEVRRRSGIGHHPPCEDDRRWWNAVLYEQGWAAPNWPVEYGGTGWTPMQQFIFERECRLADAPELRWQGLRLFGPIIYTFGNEEQKRRYLPTILTGEVQWAQGFSEPGAGSDLVALRASAVREGDEFIVNGQKLWTSEAQFSEMGFFLVRTDASVKPQAGLSMIIIDMRAPGVSVRETPMIHGGAATCEVFLDNVRVPVGNLIGELNSGWTLAKFLLGNERTSSAEIHKAYADLQRIERIARHEVRGGTALLEQADFRRRLNRLKAEVRALEWSVLRLLHGAPGRYADAALASVLKVRGSELQQALSELAVDALGVKGLREFDREEAHTLVEPQAQWPEFVKGVTADLLYLRACTIFGGSREVQKNIIAKLAFGF